MLTSLQLFSPDRAEALLTPDQTRALLGPFAYSGRRGQAARRTTRSAQFAPGAAELRHRATLRGVYDDGGAGRVRWWRLSDLDEATGGGPLQIEATWRPLWADAAEGTARDRSAVGGDLTLALTGVSPAAALAALCDPANNAPTGPGGAALLTPGAVADGLPASVDLVFDGDTTLGALEALAAALTRAVGPCEYVARVVPGPTPDLDAYAVDLRRAATDDEPTAVVALARDGTTAERLRRRESDVDVLSVLTPVAPGGEGAGTLAGNRWVVEDVAGTAAAGVVSLDLRRRSYPLPFEDVPLVVWEDGALVGYGVQVLARTDGGPVGDVLTVVASEAPNGLHVADPGYEPAAVRLLDPNGNPLVSLESPALSERLGHVERRYEFGDIHPRANLIEQTGRLAGGTEGVSADMSAWLPDGSRPYGVRVLDLPDFVDGGAPEPVLTRETDPEYVRYGTASLRVGVAAAGEGVLVQTGPYRGDLGVWLGLRVDAGEVLVRLRAHDGEGLPYVLSSFLVRGGGRDDVSVWSDVKIEVSADNYPADLGAVPVQIAMMAVGGPAEFVLDAVTVVDSVTPVAYSPHMGPEALHEAAARELARRAASGLDEYDLDALDLAELGVAGPNGVVGKPLAVGDLVRLRLTRRDAASVEELDLRVLESEYAEGVGAPPVAKRVRLGRALPTLREALRRLAGSVSGAASGGAAGGGGLGSAGVVPGTPAALVAPEAAQGTGPEAGTVVVAFDVPAAPDPEAADADTGQPATAVDVYLSHGGRRVLAQSVRPADLAAARAAGVERVRLSADALGVGDHAVTVVPSRAGVEGAPFEAVVDVVAPPYGTGTEYDLPDLRDWERVPGSQREQRRFVHPGDPRSLGAAVTVEVEGAGERLWTLPLPPETAADFVYAPLLELRGRRFRISGSTVAAGEPAALAILFPTATVNDADGSHLALRTADGVPEPVILA